MPVTLFHCHIIWDLLTQCLWHFSTATSGETCSLCDTWQASSLYDCDICQMPHSVRLAQSVPVTLLSWHIRWDFFTLCLWHLSNGTFGEASSISACDTSRLPHQVRLLRLVSAILVLSCHIRGPGRRSDKGLSPCHTIKSNKTKYYHFLHSRRHTFIWPSR